VASPPPNLAVNARHHFKKDVLPACFQLIDRDMPHGLEIAFRLRDGSTTSLPYLLLGSKQLTRNSLIRIAVNDTLIGTVELKGRNLASLYQYICQHRVESVSEADNPHITPQAQAPFVSSIELRPPAS